MIKHDIGYRFGKAFALYNVSSFFSIFTPGKIGELVKIYYLKKDSHPMKESILTVVFDRIFDVIALCIFLTFGFIFFFSFFAAELFYFVLFLVLGIIFIWIFFRFGLYRILIKKLIPSRYQDQGIFHIEDFLVKIKK